MKAFISYSHKDAAHLERLHTHLAVLRREGAVNAWYDREILAGGKIDKDIMAQLEGCDLFLALVSPDFLASNYCYETEMTKAMEQDAAGTTRIVPIILEPCDWKSTPLQQFKVIPRDGKPVSEWQNANTAFLDIVNELRRIVNEGARVQNAASPHTAVVATPSAEARRYRTKRDFDAIDRSDFRDEAFKKIRDYIQSSIVEIDGIEDIKARYTSIGPYSFSCTILNRARSRGMGALTVHAGTNNSSFGDINYSFSENAVPNTSNGGFRIEADDYDLFLKRGFSMSGGQDDRLTADQAAESMWNELLERAGVSYA